jgi:ADP-heptose:LPS heptosyltransferase
MTAVLVIRHGALGDIALGFGPFAAIRAHHDDAKITVLTTAPFAPLLRAAPWFDEVAIDPRPAWWNLPALLQLARFLRGFDMIYDLQTSKRSSQYFRLCRQTPWSGIAAGCAYPHHDKNRDFIHTIERQRGQLMDAGIGDFPPPDLGFLSIGGPVIAPPYAVLAASTSGTYGGAKTWPAAHFAELGRMIAARGITPVLIGGTADSATHAAIAAQIGTAIDLTGQTTLLDLGGVLARADYAIGGDTGPIHMAATLGTKLAVLFGPATDPAFSMPRGPDQRRIAVLRSDGPLATLPPARVAEALLAL